MKVTLFSDFDESKLKLEEVSYIGKNKLKRVFLTYDGDHLYLQLPRMFAPWGVKAFDANSKSSLDLSLKDLKTQGTGDAVRGIFEKIYTMIKSDVKSRSSELFGKDKSSEILDEIFKSNIKTSKNEKYADTLRLQIPQNKKAEPLVEIYDKSKKPQDLKYMEGSCEVVPIVHLSHLWFVGSDFGLMVKGVMFRVYKKETLKGYSFVHSDDEESEEEDISM